MDTEKPGQHSNPQDPSQKDPHKSGQHDQGNYGQHDPGKERKPGQGQSGEVDDKDRKSA